MEVAAASVKCISGRAGERASSKNRESYRSLSLAP